MKLQARLSPTFVNSRLPPDFVLIFLPNSAPAPKMKYIAVCFPDRQNNTVKMYRFTGYLCFFMSLAQRIIFMKYLQ